MPAPWNIATVLAATDLTGASVPALRYARLFAAAFGAKLTIVCGVAALEAKMHESMFLENCILFPRAIALEREIPSF